MPMDELDLSPAYVHLLILKARALTVTEDEVTPDAGGNAIDPVDHALPDTMQEEDDDLTREELIEELEGLDDDQQAELVALMWLGRGDAEPEEWADLVKLANERHESETGPYLLDHPQLAEYWAEGLDRLGYGTLLD